MAQCHIAAGHAHKDVALNLLGVPSVVSQSLQQHSPVIPDLLFRPNVSSHGVLRQNRTAIEEPSVRDG